MKAVFMLALVLSLAAAAGAASAGAFGGGSGTLKSSGGTFGKPDTGAPRFGVPSPAKPPKLEPHRIYAPAAPIKTPSAPGLIGAPRFERFKGSSVYSERGGVDAYPKPDKPKGYVDPYGRSGF